MVPARGVPSVERQAVAVSGIVQGVGFRPFVQRLATRLGLGGFVRNRSSGVWVEVEGAPERIAQFLDELSHDAPALARVDSVTSAACAPRGDVRFRIETSESMPGGGVFISPDVATCPDCLTELLDPSDRRYQYPFLNCTSCGPRLTIVTGAPYDRARTTMASFEMCPTCRADYEDPANRRFHAQPIACPRCGPRLALAGDGRGSGAPLEAFVNLVNEGGIGALKGIGGYHLVCDAMNHTAVTELRRRKQRDEKPFALMVRDLDAAETICSVSPAEHALLSSPRRPIVLLARRSDAPVSGAVAPGNPMLGVMLPYSPLHELILRVVDRPLVMTSGNRSDEPMAFEDADALARLGGVADLFLVHDRPIHVRCDDSVTRVVGGVELLIRRSRGYAPEPLPLPVACEQPILAMGGHLKTTFALGRGRHAFLSHHIGDLDTYDAYSAYVRQIDLYARLFEIVPTLVVHDLHPDYASTRHAHEIAERAGLERVTVQHHHAHMASGMAEHGLNGSVIAVTLDGTGYGTDGTIWGGEFLVGGYRTFRRAAHLRAVPMPGGERAIREPWRMAVAYLDAAGVGLDGLVPGTRDPVALRTIRTMVERGVNSPATSSVGRLFDAVAAAIGLHQTVSYEGQAAMALEWLAGDEPEDGDYPFGIEPRAPGSSVAPDVIVDTLPIVLAVAEDARAGVPKTRIARRFHSTLVEIICRVCGILRGIHGMSRVVLSGGVFQNALLLGESRDRLVRGGFSVFWHQRVPPNDGGLSMGQLVVAASSASAPGPVPARPGHP